MKTSRVPQRTLEAFGLFAIIESKRVILPLKGVECDFSVLSGLVEVSMTQIFRQENDRALDCEYLFPLPADASVFSCEADINGRVIRAQVRERNEARKIVAEKKAAGFRTALVESERDNLFTLSLGNVQPNDLVVIQLRYFQTLRCLADTRSVEIPFCPGIRYIPGKSLLRSNRGKGVVDDTNQVPDASRITPVRIDAGHPDAAYIEVRGTLDGKFVAGNSISSPSHAVAIHPVGNELRISLSDKGDVPDRDFVLRWTESNAEALISRVWVRANDAEKYALMEVRAPKNAPSERAPVDFYFLVDRSGSMRGEKWNKAAEALQSCVRVLGSNDRAMITLFETGFEDFSEGPMPVVDLLADRQFQTLQRLGTAGGTEMGPALTHVLQTAERHSRDGDKNLILITDAQVGNESAILDVMRNAPNLPVHCFGIDIALNDSLLLALCRQQGGTFHSLNPGDNIQQAVTSLGKTLGQPVLLGIQLSNGWELAEAKIPNLYAGQIHYLSARATTDRPLELTARTPMSEPVKIQFEKQATQTDAPQLHWMRSRIHRFLADGDEKAAIALSVRSNLICPLTAFIAWDETEKVAVANHEIVQPNLELCEETLTRACLMDPSALRAAPAAGGGPAALRKLSNDGSLFRRIFRSRSNGDIAAKSNRNIDLDELSLKRELSGLCHRLGIADWQPLIKSIFNWIAEANGQEHPRRLGEVNQLLRDIQKSFVGIPEPADSNRQKWIEENGKRVHEMVKSFVEKLSLQK